jgi:hypothetical protein
MQFNHYSQYLQINSHINTTLFVHYESMIVLQTFIYKGEYFLKQIV